MTSSAAGRLKRVARRIARPVLSPIDGRVADINRRIQHEGVSARGAFDRLDGALGTYATASAEATSYVGVELRRVDAGLAQLDDRVSELRDRVDQTEAGLRDLFSRSLDEYYRHRIRVAGDLPLEKLEGEVALLLNHAAGPQGFAAQANLWFNDPMWTQHVPGGVNLIGVNERIVEVPFAMGCLMRITPPARVLDVGSAESTFPLAAASLGYDVTAVDPRPLAYAHPNLTDVVARFEDWDGGRRAYSAVFLISTIEHVGRPAYGLPAVGDEAPGEGADRRMLERVRGLLADNGVLVLTTPFGTASVDDFQRVYDNRSLSRLLDGWEILERRCAARQDDLVWVAEREPAADAPGVVMVLARPTHG